MEEGEGGGYVKEVEVSFYICVEVVESQEKKSQSEESKRNSRVQEAERKYPFRCAICIDRKDRTFFFLFLGSVLQIEMYTKRKENIQPTFFLV